MNADDPVLNVGRALQLLDRFLADPGLSAAVEMLCLQAIAALTTVAGAQPPWGSGDPHGAAAGLDEVRCLLQQLPAELFDLPAVLAALQHLDAAADALQAA